MARFSTPARMTRPYRVQRRKASSPASTSTAAPISRNRSTGTWAPSTGVTRAAHSGRGYGSGSAPHTDCSSATPASDRPTVTSTCSVVRRYSGRIRTSSTSAPVSAPTRRRRTSTASGRRPAWRGPPGGVRADGQEQPVREVEHPGQPEDQGQPGGDQEVQRGQAEAGQGQQHDGGHGQDLRTVRADAEQRPGLLGVAEQVGRAAAPGHPAGGQHHGVAGQPPDHGQVLLDEQDRHAVRDRGQHGGDRGRRPPGPGPWSARRRAAAGWG